MGQKENPKYIVANCAESEPGIFKDRFILENHPDLFIGGLTVGLDVLKVKKAFVFLKKHYADEFGRKLELLADDDKRIEVFSYPSHAYSLGEETNILNVLEGKRAETRVRPPQIFEKGLWNQPTLVNNCETWHDMALIARGEYRGERFFCITGDNTPDNIFRFDENLTIREALEKSGHWPNFPFFVQLGGAMSGICLREDQLGDYRVQNFSGLVIRHFDSDEKKLVSEWLDFFANSSCGKCVPCREGFYRLRELFQSDKRESCEFFDIVFSLQKTPLCSMGKMGVTPIVSYYENIKKIKDNFDLVPGRCG